MSRGGSRLYVDHDTGVKLPSVTSVVGMLPKPYLTFWASKLTAEYAVDNLPAITSISERDREGAVDFLKRAPSRYTASRADVGSKAHDAFELLIRGERIGRVDPDIRMHVRHFEEFLDAVNPELVYAEDIAWSESVNGREDLGYAGSFDGIVRIWVREENGRPVPTPDRSGEPVLLVVDWKTGKSTYPDVALQLTAYARAKELILTTGERMPMPETDGAAVLHVTDQEWSFKPVDTDTHVFDQFLYLRETYNWDRGASKKVIGKPLASGGRMQTGTARRAK
jgi:hypothetical protein